MTSSLHSSLLKVSFYMQMGNVNSPSSKKKKEEEMATLILMGFSWRMREEQRGWCDLFMEWLILKKGQPLHYGPFSILCKDYKSMNVVYLSCKTKQHNKPFSLNQCFPIKI